MLVRLIGLGLVLLVSAGNGATAEEEEVQNALHTELSFLESGRDYIIRFPGDQHLFKVKKSGVTSTTYRADDGSRRAGRPARWTLTLTVEIFRVVEFGGGSWVLLEHPSEQDDFVKWNRKRRAMAQLSGMSALEDTSIPGPPEGLQKLQEAAALEIPTERTWVNLSHAIAIRDVPTGPLDNDASARLNDENELE